MFDPLFRFLQLRKFRGSVTQQLGLSVNRGAVHRPHGEAAKAVSRRYFLNFCYRGVRFFSRGGTRVEPYGEQFSPSAFAENETSMILVCVQVNVVHGFCPDDRCYIVPLLTRGGNKINAPGLTEVGQYGPTVLYGQKRPCVAERDWFVPAYRLVAPRLCRPVRALH
jgi:hypothetical protein